MSGSPIGWLDWAILYAQILALAWIVVREVARPAGRNLFAILVSVILLVLVQGQAWWVFSRFNAYGGASMRHLLATISVEGARRANLYIGACTACFVVGLAPWRKRAAAPGSEATGEPPPQRGVYLLATVWTLVTGYLLLKMLGGLSAAFSRPGQSIAGQTVLLIALGMGKLPPLHSLASGGRWRLRDVCLLGFTLLLLLVNSRMLAAFAVVQLAVVYNYRCREISRRSLVGLAASMAIIFLGFGLYRQYSTFRRRVPGVPLATFAAQMGVQGAANWFYLYNVEGFAGVAGILSDENVYGPTRYDYGLSLLQTAFQFLPNSIRSDPSLPFAAESDYLLAQYPYAGSVVSPGMENAYGCWGLLGILSFGVALGVVTRAADERAAAHGGWQTCVLSVYLFQFVRGTFPAALFFLTSEWAMLRVYGWLLKATAGRRAVVSGRASGPLPA